MKSIQQIKKLPISDKEILVWAFIPSSLSADINFSNKELDPVYFQQELAEVFAELDVAWKFKLITLENMKAVIEEVAVSQAQYFPLVLNYCAGLDEIDGYPGASVVKLLEAKGIPFTGADSQFFKMGDSKILMKQAFVEAGVSTAPSEVIKDVNSIRGLCDRLVPPLIVKPSASFGTRGISLQSVIHTDEEWTSRYPHGGDNSRDVCFRGKSLSFCHFHVSHDGCRKSKYIQSRYYFTPCQNSLFSSDV